MAIIKTNYDLMMRIFLSYFRNQVPIVFKYISPLKGNISDSILTEVEDLVDCLTL